jgi:hypothetical protein
MELADNKSDVGREYETGELTDAGKVRCDYGRKDLGICDLVCCGLSVFGAGAVCMVF